MSGSIAGSKPGAGGEPQVQVGRRLELSGATISELMYRLERRGLLDRAPAYPTTENRTFLTAAGKRLAAQGRVIVDRVSAVVPESQGC